MGLRRQRQARTALFVAIWFAAALMTSPVKAETAVYLPDREEEAKPRTSLLSQWTEPAPQSPPKTNDGKASKVQQAQFGGGRPGLFGQPNSGLPPAAPAQLPPGYGAYPGQTVPSANGLLNAVGLGMDRGRGSASASPSPFSSGSPAPTYGPTYGGAGYGGYGGVSNPYGSPYASSQGYNPYATGSGHGQPPAGYAAPHPGYGGYQQAAPSAAYPFETLGSEAAKSLPAPSAASVDSQTAPSTDVSADTGTYHPPVNGGGFESLWGGGGSGYNGHGYQSFDSCGPTVPYSDPYPSMPYGVRVGEPLAQSGCPSLCGCDPCASRYWWRADLLFGWINGFDTPRLLTRSPEDTGLEDVMDPTSPFTQTIFGGRGFGDDVRIGGRIAGGMWLDECRKWGVQVDAFALGNDSEKININSDGDPILSRPFYNQDPNVAGPDGQILALEGIATGSFTASTSGRLVSVGPSLRFNICCCGGAPPVVACCDPCDPCCDPCAAGYSSAMSSSGGGCGGGACGLGGSSRVDLIAGYRFLQLKEGYFAQEVLTPIGSDFVDGTSLTLVDDVDTQNDFHAFELGAIWQWQRDNLLFDFGWSAAFGELTRRHSVSGSTTFGVPGILEDSHAGGFSVRPDRIGSFKDSKFTVVPQARIGVGYCLFDNFRLHADYSFLYLDNVFRPGAFLADSFDGRELGADPSFGTVGSAASMRPAEESVILHALSLGVSCNY